MPTKCFPSERIKSFPEAPRCTCVSWGDCFPYNSVLFKRFNSFYNAMRFNAFHTIRWFWRNSMLSTEFNAGSTGARALLWHKPTKGSAFLIVVIFHILPRIIPNCVTFLLLLLLLVFVTFLLIFLLLFSPPSKDLSKLCYFTNRNCVRTWYHIKHRSQNAVTFEFWMFNGSCGRILANRVISAPTKKLKTKFSPIYPWQPRENYSRYS